MPVLSVPHYYMTHVYAHIVSILGACTDGEAVSVAYLAPSVTPWRYISAALNTSYHNPGIRLIEYDTDNLSIVDYTQYYFDLHTANEGESSIELSSFEVYCLVYKLTMNEFTSRVKPYRLQTEVIKCR